MTAIAFETTGPLAVITMTHEPHNLLGPDLMEPQALPPPPPDPPSTLNLKDAVS